MAAGNWARYGEASTAGVSLGEARAVAVPAALVVAAGLALRGRIPGETAPVPADPPPSSPASAVAALALMAASVVLMGVALIAAARRPARPRRPAGRELPRPIEGPTGPRRRRWWLAVALGVAAAVTLLLIVVGPPSMQPPEPPSPPAEPTAAPSGAVATARPEPRRERPPDPGDDLSGYLVATTAALVLMSVAGVLLSRRHRPPAETPADSVGPPPPPAAGPLAVAAERGLAEVEDLSRQPREAIIACYAAMERALTRAGAAPLASDTPSEVLARAVTGGALRAQSAGTLVELFAEARFSSHLMTETHRADAEGALRTVLADLRSRT